ncbi:nuclear transport factor 2 family protein [Thermomicrobium sp. 4228-Ro]|uniref:nuclear transport factor 2 family protein n=1 Tax=Thermomicrobium sp. 4228-Ro TaxID=2993937 RepID=UPI00224908AA|nr:nuclear transport factor 2 family protein [Thermomicrobium sp. 4228-Ro]MCX2727968.1 nuclear transport factor 2 family protein [Thermomicrobium sp. 4228-Ro]
MRRVLAAWFFFTLSSVFFLACSRAAPVPTPTPFTDPADEVRAVVTRYLDAIYHGRAGEAWLMHSRATNDGESFDEFMAVVQAAAEIGSRIEILEIDQPEIRGNEASVIVVQRLGPRVSTYMFHLVYEDGVWKIHNPRDLVPQP